MRNSLRYIIGKKGSGKTTLCIDEIIDAQKKGNTENIIYIVPEQFSLSAERAIMAATKTDAMMQIQVLSFRRLAYSVLAELGCTNKPIIDDIGKTIILRKIISDKKSGFEYYTSGISNAGFIEKLLRQITEFTQYGVTPEILMNTLSSLDENKDRELISKIKDLCIIYSAYLEFISEKHSLSEECFDILAKKIPFSKKLDNAQIWIDGFYTFTTQEYAIIAALIMKCPVNIAMTLNTKKISFDNINPYDPYADIKTAVSRITGMARENGTEILPVKYLIKDRRHISRGDLAHLTEKYQGFESFEYEDVGNITVNAYLNMAEETDAVCVQIMKLLREEGYRYNDIAVIVGSDDYKKTLGSAFEMYGIPAFMDNKAPISSHILTMFIKSALDIFITNFSYEAVFNFLKTTFICYSENYMMSAEDIALLDNYAVSYGIKGWKWHLKDWSAGFETFDKEEIMRIRNTFLSCIDSVSMKSGKKYTAREISEKIFMLMENMNVSKTIESWANRDKFDDPFLAGKHIQTYNSVIDILDTIVDVLGDMTLDLREYSAIIMDCFNTAMIGVLPPTQDQVVVGNVERTRLHDVKALFFLGVNDGNVPAYIDDSGCLNDNEKKTLFADNGIQFSPDIASQLMREQFSIYSLLSLPSEKLYVSYVLSSINGDSMQPSVVINRLKKIFKEIPKLEISQADKMAAPEAAFRTLVSKIGHSEGEDESGASAYYDAAVWFCGDERYREKFKNIKEGLELLNSGRSISSKSVRKIYSSDIITAISRLESYNMCPFSYFVKYDMGVRERRDFKVTSLDLGNFYHSILEIFSDMIKENNFNWFKIGYDEADKLVSEAAELAEKRLGNDIFKDNARNMYIRKRAEYISKLSIYAVITQIKKGSFYPYGFEVEFSSSPTDEKSYYKPIKIPLDEKHSILLTGKIDRIDIMTNDENCYVKIIDYKSSDKKFELMDVYYGVQLQLLLYVDTFMKLKEKDKEFGEREIKPGGAFYFSLSEKELAHGLANMAEMAEMLAEKYRHTGIIYDDENVIKALGETDENNKRKKMPKGYTGSKMVGADDFKALLDYIPFVTKKTVKNMIEGDISVRPYRSACEYCSYKSICGIGFIEKNSDDLKRVRTIKDVIPKIKEEMGEVKE
ncbi:MAG: PD-(D/E)XK nuclease family protein [Firmicutes bacterium]|nr:PD-(D/E)XK nuclease family protein [Bacillota bacterium]